MFLSSLQLVGGSANGATPVHREPRGPPILTHAHSRCHRPTPDQSIAVACSKLPNSSEKLPRSRRTSRALPRTDFENRTFPRENQTSRKRAANKNKIDVEMFARK